MKKIQFILYTTLIICLNSCEKDSNVKLPEVAQKLVLSCVLSPQDTAISVDVSLSRPIFNNSSPHNLNEKVSNATVIISSAAGSWTLSFDAISGRYVIDTSQLKVRAGMTYDLSVSTPDGKFAKATTSIPYPNRTLSCTTSSNSTSVNKINIYARWQDPELSSDYYRFEIYNTNKSNYLTYQSDIITDAENPGGILKRNWQYGYLNSANDTLNACLYTISPELYTYYDRVKKTNDANGPFSEPVAMFTNVEGGFGIFGGFNGYKIRVLP
jgi:hypothetical protein